MDILKPTSIEDRIIAVLRSGPRLTTAILAHIQEETAVTKQGFYSALRSLHRDEIVTIAQKIVSINTTWIYRMERALERMRQPNVPSANLLKRGFFDVSSFEPGDSATFHFTTVYQLDTFWGHVHNLLHKHLPVTDPLFIYDPHYWFYVARPETERDLLESMTQEGRQFLLVVGGTTNIDKEIKKFFTSDWMQCDLRKVFDKANYYVSVMGAYIIEAWFDIKLSADIDRLFVEHQSISASLQLSLIQFLNTKGRNRLKISCNPTKAKALKTTLGKGFYIKK